MKFTPQQEFYALGVRSARKKRDLLARRYKLLINGKTNQKSQERAIELVGNQDDVVQAHIRQFTKSLIPKKEEEIEYQEL